MITIISLRKKGSKLAFGETAATIVTSRERGKHPLAEDCTDLAMSLIEEQGRNHVDCQIFEKLDEKGKIYKQVFVYTHE